MKIIYKKAAIDDLLNTENYIINQFHNDQAAKKLKNNIVDTISLLKDNPYLGPKMSDRFDIDTPFRYLIVSKQLVFYNVNEKNIEIIEYLTQGRITYHYYFNYYCRSILFLLLLCLFGKKGTQNERLYIK